MVNLQFIPNITFIDVTWELDNPSEKVDEYRIDYAGHDGQEFHCYSTGTTTVGSGCNSNIFLFPCTGYDITVQPLDNRNSIGVPATDTSYTLTGKESNEHILSFIN